MITHSINEGEQYVHSSGVLATVRFFAQSKIPGITDELVVYTVDGGYFVKTLRNFKEDFMEKTDSH
jgi:hypothetical protein